MKRRSFLKLLGIGTVSIGALHSRHFISSILIDGKIKEPYPHKEDGFCEFCEYGQSIPYIGQWKDVAAIGLIPSFLHKAAKKVLPPGTYYEIRLKLPHLPQDLYDAEKGVAWYRSPYMHQRLGTLAKPELDEFGSYLFVGGYLA